MLLDVDVDPNATDPNRNLDIARYSEPIEEAMPGTFLHFEVGGKLLLTKICRPWTSEHTTSCYW